MRGYQSYHKYLIILCLIAAPAFRSATVFAGDGKPREGRAEHRLSIDEEPSRKTDFKAKVGPADEVKIHIDLGRVYETQENFDAAIGEYSRAIEAAQRKRSRKDGPAPGRDLHALAHRRMGNVLDRIGQFEQAEVHYREALKHSPNDPKVWNDAGYSYHLQNRWADAERSLKTAVRLDKTDPRYQINLGLTLASAGKTDEAIKVLTKVAGEPAAHANVGYILAGRGQTEQARVHYQKALALQPDFPVAVAALRRLAHDQTARNEGTVDDSVAPTASSNPAATPASGRSTASAYASSGSRAYAPAPRGTAQPTRSGAATRAQTARTVAEPRSQTARRVAATRDETAQTADIPRRVYITPKPIARSKSIAVKKPAGAVKTGSSADADLRRASAASGIPLPQEISNLAEDSPE
jgi:tetratricopeptide (TPR) repeat protein